MPGRLGVLSLRVVELFSLQQVPIMRFSISRLPHTYATCTRWSGPVATARGGRIVPITRPVPIARGLESGLWGETQAPSEGAPQRR
jgi:hypothetical protein